MTRLPVQDPTFAGFGRRPHAQSTHTHRHSSSGPSAQQPPSMDAHRLSKCFFSTHVPPRTGEEQGLRASPSLPRLELPASLLALHSVSQSVTRMAAVRSHSVSNVISTPYATHCLPISPHMYDDPAELEGHLGQQRSFASCAQVVSVPTNSTPPLPSTSLAGSHFPVLCQTNGKGPWDTNGAVSRRCSYTVGCRASLRESPFNRSVAPTSAL